MKLIKSESIEYINSRSLTHKQIIEHLQNKLPHKMVEFCKQNKGVGLAAPQIGLFQNFFIARINEIWSVFFNPVIVHYSDNKIMLEEGCLSYAGLFVTTERSKDIVVQFAQNNSIATKKYSDIDAVIFQHEFDHLNGVTINTLLKEEKAKKVDNRKNNITL